ncbi:hypothetical protein C8R48DRAFT_112286 [Suillus tomentosus]|nr:hypothetical protein C8R48DRAFT_112286 [Suillus tomentosus]
MFYSNQFLPADHRPADHVVLLPTIESVLYGANTSDILTHFSIGPILCQYRRRSQNGGQKRAQYSTRLSRYARPRCRCLSSSTEMVIYYRGKHWIHPKFANSLSLLRDWRKGRRQLCLLAESSNEVPLLVLEILATCFHPTTSNPGQPKFDVKSYL